MNMLLGIWTASWVLAVVSVVLMGGLIIRRTLSQRRESRRRARKDELTPLVFKSLDGEADIAGMALSRADLDLLWEISRDLLEQLRGEAGERLVALLRETGSVGRYLEMLSGGTRAERLTAVRNLSLLREQRVFEALIGRLDDESPEVRLAAAEELVNLGVEVPVGELIAKLDFGFETGSLELQKIFRKLAKGKTEEIIRVLDAEERENVRIVLIDALGRGDDYAAVSAIIRQFDSPSVDVRAESMRALAALSHPDSIPVVLGALGDESWVVRAQAAICVGRIGVSSAVDQLAGLLDDPEWWVQFRAAESLVRLGGRGLETLRAISGTPSPAGRVAQIVLAERGEP